MSEPPPPLLSTGVKLLFGVILPHCGLVLLAFAMSGRFRHDEAGGFAALGFFIGASIVIGISFIVDLCIVAFISFRNRTAVVLAGCIVPLVALLLLAGSKP